jgi:suppressor for copper-sensitivity B
MRFALLSLFCFLTLIASHTAFAAETKWEPIEDIAKIQLIGTKSDNNSADYQLGLNLELFNKWHTYWRHPGDGGLPPGFDFTGSTNIKSSTVIYPGPERFLQVFEGYDPIETFGYGHHILFPIMIEAEDPSKPVHVKLSVNLGICDEICVFHGPKFDLNIPASVDVKSQTQIAEFLNKSTNTLVPNGLSVISTEISDKTLTVVAISSKTPFSNPDVFVEAGDDFRFPKADVKLSDGGKTATFAIKYGELSEGKDLAQTTPTFTLVSNGASTEHKGFVTGIKKNETNTLEISHSVLFYILYAIIGGLILNIMPCVLPVLSLKVLGIMSHGGESNRNVRSSFVMTILGILASFLVLALIVIVLKQAGAAVGWGFHFQQPAFLIFLIIILNMFASNQWDIFEIQLPSWLGGKINDGLDKTKNHSAMGNFATGAFATLMATPCSAPFLGSAVSFALSESNTTIAIIFFSMGVGLALPYILFALAPSLVTKMPKPGAWMLKVKHAMGGILLITSAYFLWVLSNQLGLTSALIVAGLSVSSIILLVFYKRTSGFTLRQLMLCIAIGVPLTFYLPIKMMEMDHATDVEQSLWVPFNEAAIARHVADGKVVFIDITADWCLTCKANKWRVLSDMQVMRTLEGAGVVAMQGDMSSPSPTIAAYLKANGRYGIPFNIVYGPSAAKGIPLSELLNIEDTLKAIEDAK